MKKMLVSLLALTLVFGMTACSGGNSAEKPAQEAASPEATEPSGESEDTSGEKLKILCLINNLADNNSLNYANAVEERAGELADTVEVTVMDSKSDISKQIAQMEDGVTQKVDAIIIQPNDAEALNGSIDLCVEAGIPVIEMSLKTTNENYTAFVGLSDVVGGRIVSEYIFEQLGGEGKVAHILGNEGSSAVNDRAEGFKNALEEYPDIEVIAEQSAHWQRAEALELAEDWLTTYPDLKAIICQNDDMALGVVEAIESMDRTDVLVGGVNAIADALTAVKEGRLDATVYMDSHNVGVTALNLAVAAAQGETVEKETRLDMKIVHGENIDEYLN